MSYRQLKTYKSATIIYDFTVDFCRKYSSYWSTLFPRLSDQMISAARSAKQNIVEGSNEKTSKKMELKLLGVARASLQELLEDYEDFLRQNNFKQWKKNSPEAEQVRKLVYRPNWSYRSYRPYLSKPDLAANAMICLINQTNYLLDRQINTLREKFLSQGGWTEQMFKERLKRRKKNLKL